MKQVKEFKPVFDSNCDLPLSMLVVKTSVKKESLGTT